MRHLFAGKDLPSLTAITRFVIAVCLDDDDDDDDKHDNDDDDDDDDDNDDDDIIPLDVITRRS